MRKRTRWLLWIAVLCIAVPAAARERNNNLSVGRLSDWNVVTGDVVINGSTFQTTSRTRMSNQDGSRIALADLVKPGEHERMFVAYEAVDAAAGRILIRMRLVPVPE